jgi:phosphoribosyl-ATP pyrophosphohydrolase/phosphoribosyl-AMP cyclohydrolase
VIASLDPDSLTYDERGLLPVVAQDVATGAVLMVAWADRAAVARTAETGFACFYSRSRRAPWMKGETSGNRLRVVDAREDCDRDTLLLRVHPEGPACHRGTRTCFEPDPSTGEPPRPNPARLELGWLWEVLERRRQASPEESYTARLLAAGPERIAQKLGEEGVETALAAVTRDDDGVVEEAADLLYHLLTLLLARDIEPERVSRALVRRHREREG